MTREEFIEELDKRRYSYKIEGDKLVVTEEGDVWMKLLKTIPPDIEFRNDGNVWLNSLENLPHSVKFSNGWNVHLDSLKKISPGVDFNNRGLVFLDRLEVIPPGVRFNNIGYVSLFVGYTDVWDCNIEGIDSNMLFNSMINRGVFI